MTKKPTTPKGKAKAHAQALTAKVERSRLANNRKRVKPPYLNPYLLASVSQALTLPAIEKATVRDASAPVVVVDVRKVVLKVKDTLHLRPDNTLRARLETLTALDPKVAKVGYLRYLASNHPNAVEGHDDAYKVILYRQK